MSKAIAWLAEHDRNFGALRRATRAAIVMPAMLAIADKVIANAQVATFAAFGSFAMLLLVDFAGSIRDRLEAEAALAVACGVLICLGTLASTNAWLAAAAMAVVGFGIIFSGVVSSVLAGATTPLLLSFILPVSLPGPVSSIPFRVAGWGLASAAALLAISLLWPAPARDPVRGMAISACRALANRLRVEVTFILSGRDPALQSDREHAIEHADQAIEQLDSTFFATPYRPTGLSTSARAVVRLVDELRWLNSVVLRSAPRPVDSPAAREVCAVKVAAAGALEAAAELLENPASSATALDQALGHLRDTLHMLEATTTSKLPALDEPPRAGDGARTMVSSLDPSFRAQELSFVVSQIARNTEFAAAAERRNLVDRLLGRQPEGFAGVLSAARERAGSHVDRNSLTLHNALRGAAGLGLAVLAADLIGVQHAFWVVFGTLSVLRSSALSTGQNIVRALVGALFGFAVGALIVTVVGTNTTLLWGMLPFVVLVAGLAPATISFAAGQAAFTVTLLILFNILAPAGWRIGIVRIEDVALGGAVSFAVGLLFWPRGAAAALGRALSAAYVDSAAYLSSAVAYGVGRCDASNPPSATPTVESQRAAAAARRLDDTFRGYLSERGAKPVRLAEVTRLLTGVTGLRLAADAVLDLWDGDQAATGDRAAARRELLQRSREVSDWYGGFAGSLVGASEVPIALDGDGSADERLVQTVGHDLRDADGQATATAVRVIWTGDHLDAARRLQDMLVGPARDAVSQHALS
jgi:hypothetical protein